MIPSSWYLWVSQGSQSRCDMNLSSLNVGMHAVWNVQCFLSTDVAFLLHLVPIYKCYPMSIFSRDFGQSVPCVFFCRISPCSSYQTRLLLLPLFRVSDRNPYITNITLGGIASNTLPLRTQFHHASVEAETLRNSGRG